MKTTLWFAVCLMTAQLSAQTLTANQAVTRGLAQSDLVQLLEALENRARSDVSQARTWDNPYLGFNQQDAGETLESELTFSQTFALFGTRQSAVAAAEGRRQAVVYDNDARRLQAAREIKRLFFEARYQVEAWRVSREMRNEIEKAAKTVAQRVAQGTASGYDQRRLALALADAKTRATERKARYDAAMAELMQLLALEQRPDLRGDLLPPPPASVTVTKSPGLRALAERRSAARQEQNAIKRLSEVTVRAGLRRVEVDGFSDEGYVVGASLPLPAWDQKQAARSRARAQIASYEAEYNLALLRLSRREEALRTQITSLREAALTFRQGALQTADELADIAVVAYREGEMTLLEMLDAFQARHDAQLHIIDMSLRVRALAIEREALGGAP